MPKIVIAANVFEDNKKFGSVVAVFGILSLGLFLASLFVSPTAFSFGVYVATDVFLIFFYIAFAIFVIFLLVFLIKFGYGKKILEFVRSGKLREITEQIKGVKEEFEAIGKQIPIAQKTFGSLTKIFSKEKPTSSGTVASPSEVASKMRALISTPNRIAPGRIAALQMTPSESPSIMIIPKTRAPVNDVPRVAFVGDSHRRWPRFAVLLVSINIFLVLGIMLALVLTGAILWGI